MRLGDRLRRVLDASPKEAPCDDPEAAGEAREHAPEGDVEALAAGMWPAASGVDAATEVHEDAPMCAMAALSVAPTPQAAPLSPLRAALANLERLSRTRRTPTEPSSTPASGPDLRQLVGLGSLGHEPPPALSEALPGEARASGTHGATWVARTHHPFGERHGLHELGRALDQPFDHLERLTGDPRLAGFDPRRALYLDIEATGLEHGAGTLAFMIGLGFVAGDEVIVEQLVLRDPDEERAQLELMWATLERFPFLVSFNGKSFDLSVLQNRLVMNRLCSAREGELKLRPHLDLLHLGRNLYKGTWADVRLQTLEQKVLGFVREGDMPGALAPACWFAWLRDGDPRPLAAIARHNRWDVLSMVALAGHMAEAARPLPDAGRTTTVALNLARLFARRRHPSDALAILAEPPPLRSPDEVLASLELEATCARRVGDHARACRALAELCLRRPEDPALRAGLSRAERKRDRAQVSAPP